LKPDNNQDIWGGSSLKPDNDRDIWGGSSLKPDNDQDIWGGFSLKSDNDRDIWGGFSLKSVLKLASPSLSLLAEVGPAANWNTIRLKYLYLDF